MVGYAGSPTYTVYVDVTLTRSKVKVKVTGLLNFRQLEYFLVDFSFFVTLFLLEVGRYGTLYPVYPHANIYKFSVTRSMIWTIMLCRQHIKYNERIRDIMNHLISRML